MMMSNYQTKVSDCINDKLVDFCMTEAKSIYNVDLLYHHYIQEVSTIFHTPREHYTKILTIAYHKTICQKSEISEHAQKCKAFPTKEMSN